MKAESSSIAETQKHLGPSLDGLFFFFFNICKDCVDFVIVRFYVGLQISISKQRAAINFLGSIFF